MSITKWPHRLSSPKDPDATLDYQVDWSDWLAPDESIAVSEWVVAGADIVSEESTAALSTVWVKGGTVGQMISLTNRITTDNTPIARVDDRTLLVKVAQR
jgi:hypothetical protein